MIQVLSDLSLILIIIYIESRNLEK